MKLIVISPEAYEPREHAMLAEFFAAGLERYHVRKPSWTEAAVHRFVQTIPAQWRSRLVLHQHHELATELGCGGVHFKDGASVPAVPAVGRPHFTSRSCHDLNTLQRTLGYFDAVFLSPMFPSISKPGYVPSQDHSAVAATLEQRTTAQRKTAVIALGGITPANAARCAELGFDGVAVLGALWNASQPRKVFEQLQQALSAHAV